MTDDVDRGRSEQLADNLTAIRARIATACAAADRDEREITLVAVSKGHPTEAIRKLASIDQRDFGESYVQEWLARDPGDREPGDQEPVRWHFIGRLQSRKARQVAAHSAAAKGAVLIHSVDRESLIDELAARATSVLPILLQVNVGEDPAKAGVAADEAVALLQRAVGHATLRICGLMTIPPLAESAEDSRVHFRELRVVFEQCRSWLLVNAPEKYDDFRELSMGMSDDFEVAIAEGATIVRIGTALFGERT